MDDLESISLKNKIHGGVDRSMLIYGLHYTGANYPQWRIEKVWWRRLLDFLSSQRAFSETKFHFRPAKFLTNHDRRVPS